MKNISILGSTGSIGKNTIEVVRNSGRFKIVGLAAKSNTALLLEQIEEFKPKIVAVWDEASADLLRRKVDNSVKIVTGISGLTAVSAYERNDIVVSALVGAVGLIPTLEAVKLGKDIALANKEVLVMAGSIVMDAAAKSGSKILPVDSEHSAIFQCLNGERKEDIKRIIITASGGPFLDTPVEKLRSAGAKEALNHPRWSMGKKVTVDSASLMNKGLEVIEAMWLFGVDLSRIEVVIHKESIIHSMVEFVDGSVIAQMSEPDMKIPIQYALTYPAREKGRSRFIDFAKLKNLSFQMPDNDRFPALGLAYRAAKEKGTLPAVLNAANEIAVHEFLEERIGFLEMASVVKSVMDEHKNKKDPDIDDVLAADQWARDTAREGLTVRRR